MTITQEYLKSILEYNPEIGEFIWKTRENVPKFWNTKYAGKKAGRINCNGYGQICIDHKHHSTHRLAWLYVHGELPDQIDHINLFQYH